MKFIKYLLLIALFTKSIADPNVPLIKQFSIKDNYGYIWQITATSINGIFPAKSAIIDGISSDYDFTATPEESVLNLIGFAIVQDTATLVSYGQIAYSVQQNIIMKAYTVLNLGSVVIDYMPQTPVSTSGVVSFHIVYQ